MRCCGGRNWPRGGTEAFGAAGVVLRGFAREGGGTTERGAEKLRTAAGRSCREEEGDESSIDAASKAAKSSSSVSEGGMAGGGGRGGGEATFSRTAGAGATAGAAEGFLKRDSMSATNVGRKIHGAQCTETYHCAWRSC